MVTQTMKTWDEIREHASLLHTVTRPYDHRSPLAQYAYLRDGDSSQMQRLAPPTNRTDPNRPHFYTSGTYPMTDVAEGQLMSKIRYPRQLLDRLPANNVLIDVNWLIQNSMDNDRNALFRFYRNPATEENTLRAVLGSRYTPIDDMDLFWHIDKYLQNATIVYDGWGSTSTHITAIWEDNLEGGLKRGLHISNSEVGQRSISIGAVLYRETCGNILPGFYDSGSEDASGYDGGDNVKLRVNRKGYAGKIQSQWRFRHQGSEERLKGWIDLAMEDLETQYSTTIAKWNQGLKTLVEDPLEAIASISRKATLTQEQLQAAINSWAETKLDFGSCTTGVANAFTLGAQDFAAPEARYQMQNAGSLALSILQ